nr:vegetative cell wall protein gp1-like [Lolium perenne]
MYGCAYLLSLVLIYISSKFRRQIPCISLRIDDFVSQFPLRVRPVHPVRVRPALPARPPSPSHRAHPQQERHLRLPAWTHQHSPARPNAPGRPRQPTTSRPPATANATRAHPRRARPPGRITSAQHRHQAPPPPAPLAPPSLGPRPRSPPRRCRPPPPSAAPAQPRLAHSLAAGPSTRHHLDSVLLKPPAKPITRAESTKHHQLALDFHLPALPCCFNQHCRTRHSGTAGHITAALPPMSIRCSSFSSL